MIQRHLVLTAAALLVAVVLPAAPAAANAVTETSDTLSIVKEGESPSNVEVAVALSQQTPLAPQRVLIGRDDEFVDSMAAGVLQSDSPLLLVPPAGPVPDEVMAELTRLGPETVTLLGGEAALEPQVEQELAAAGYATERRAGASRFETAIAIAEEAPAQDDTVIIARAFASDDAADPTQAFADSLAAGGMAAEQGWPILLTQTDQLTTPTRDWLADNGVRTALIMGGTAAISQAVEEEIQGLGIGTERVAGSDRFSTGIAVAAKLGAETAADVGRVTLVDAQGADAWAGGFAAAAHSATFDAPIVLAAGDTVPPATEMWLAGGTSFAQAPDGIRLTCVVSATACEEGRVDLALPPVIPVTFTPPTGSTVTPGATVVVDTGGQAATVGGSCVDVQQGLLPADGTVQLTRQPAGPQCDLVVSLSLGADTVQTETATYVFAPDGAAGPQVVSTTADGQAVGGRYADLSDDGQVMVYLSDGDPAGVGASGVHTYAVVDGTPTLVDIRPDGSPAEGTLLPSTEVAPQVIGSGRHAVVFASPDPALASDGTVGTTTGTNVYVRDLASSSVRLISLDVDGNPVQGADFGAASTDGRTYTYTGTGVATPEGNPSRYIFIHRQFNGTTDVVRDVLGNPFANADPGVVVMSGDGSTVAFSSARADLVSDDTNLNGDIYAYDIAAQTIERINVASDGSQATGAGPAIARHLGITDDGSRLIFASAADNLGGPAGEHVYIRDRSSGQTLYVDFGPGEQSVPSISGDGLRLGLLSTLPPDGSTGETGCSLWALDATQGTASRADVPTPSNVCPAERTAVASTGAMVYTHPDRLTPADVNDVVDAYLFIP